jgi:hypothetical protein
LLSWLLLAALLLLTGLLSALSALLLTGLLPALSALLLTGLLLAALLTGILGHGLLRVTSPRIKVCKPTLFRWARICGQSPRSIRRDISIIIPPNSGPNASGAYTIIPPNLAADSNALVGTPVINERGTRRPELDRLDRTENDVVARHHLDLDHAAIESDDRVREHWTAGR